MFFLIQREDEVQIPPKMMGKEFDENVMKVLRAKVEGKCTGRFGYTIAVVKQTKCSEGRLHVDTGYCHVLVQYVALVMRSFQNEIIQAKAGPLEIFVAMAGMPDDMKFEQSREGLDCYYSAAEDLRVETGMLLRVKVVAQLFAVNQITVVGTINADFLT